MKFAGGREGVSSPLPASPVAYPCRSPHIHHEITQRKRASTNVTTEPIPDMTKFMKPSTLGDIAAYTFGGAGGVFIGGELGLLGGSVSASSSLGKDPESRKRIETAFRRFKADVLRREAEMLETGKGDVPHF